MEGRLLHSAQPGREVVRRIRREDVSLDFPFEVRFEGDKLCEVPLKNGPRRGKAARRRARGRGRPQVLEDAVQKALGKPRKEVLVEQTHLLRQQRHELAGRVRHIQPEVIPTQDQLLESARDLRPGQQPLGGQDAQQGDHGLALGAFPIHRSPEEQRGELVVVGGTTQGTNRGHHTATILRAQKLLRELRGLLPELLELQSRRV
mmetsp:Transcript_44449/g.129261  ORF Transcript_44449/g.129261 Transcript_44449/m.129261 type:complete len:204 (-) Transcript_44449:364-975(-)